MERISLKCSPLPPRWSLTLAVVNLPALTGGAALWSGWPPLSSLEAVSQSEEGDIRRKYRSYGKGICTASNFFLNRHRKSNMQIRSRKFYHFEVN